MSEAVYQPFPDLAAWSRERIDLPSLGGYGPVPETSHADGSAAVSRPLVFATRAAAIDTGAIEGLYEVDRAFTTTVADGDAAAERVLAAREPVVRRSFQDALRAYDFAFDLATTQAEVSEKAIREIHQLICAGQETYRVITPVG